MERLEAGQPPLILGDGTQTMDFVYVDDVARANMLALSVRRVRRGVQRGERRRDEPERTRGGAVARHGRRRVARVRAGAQGQRRAAAARRRPSKAERLLGFRAAVPLDEGLRRLVAWWRAARVRAVTTTASTIPVARPWMDEREAEAARRAILSGWVTQGPEVAAFEREFAAAVGARTPARCRAARRRLHLALLGVRRRARRRSRHRQPLVHRDGQRHPLLRRDAGVRGRRAGHVQHGPDAARGGDHAAHQGDPVRASARDAVRPRGDSRDGRAPSACRSIEDAACAVGQRDPRGTGAGSGSAGRTATSPASRFIRASCSRPATAAC